jgi:hypothetical protein
MSTYYVATLSRYVLVEADNERDARERGFAALYDLYADVRERAGSEVPITIRTVRPATADEIEWDRWHQQSASADKASA